MRRATEAECQQAIIESAKTGGWLVHASNPSTPEHGHVGWPDLVLLRPCRAIFALTLNDDDTVSAEQTAWLDALIDHFAHVDTYEADVSVWHLPKDLDVVCSALAQGRIPRIEGSDEW